MIFGKKRRQTEFKSWHGYLFIGVILIAIVLGVVQRVGTPRDDNGVPIDSVPASAILSEETCKLSGGAWNQCGSTCRNVSGLPCIELCVKQCECADDSECPFGFKCDDIIDGVGICLGS